MLDDRSSFEKIADIEKLLKTSNNTLYKYMPGFTISIIKNITREEHVNKIHNKHSHKMGIDYVNAILEEFNIKVVIHNKYNLDTNDRCIFVANHPLGGIDALAFLQSIYKLKGSVISPSNEILTNIKNIAPLIVGVNVFGTNSREQINKISKVFESDAQVMIFPAGIVSRKINGEITDLPWQKTFINKAVQSKRYVIPVYIAGKNSNKFYRIVKFRKALGIKLPIEVLYFPQEMFKKQGESINLYFGEPIHYSTFNNSKSKEYWTDFVRNKVYNISEQYKD